MNFLNLAEKRYSCRSYQDKPVERDKLTACVEAARFSPSACNSQPWSFVIVDDSSVAKDLSPALLDRSLPFNKFTRNCSAYIVIVEEKANLSSKFGGILKDQHYAQMDIGIAAEHIALCASDQGLGSCIMGWFSNRKLKKILGIPRAKRVRLVIAVGYPQENAFRAKVRKSLETVVHYNKW